MSKLCVSNFCVSGRSGRADGRTGVRNQKQEPHTKMWGIKLKNGFREIVNKLTHAHKICFEVISCRKRKVIII